MSKFPRGHWQNISVTHIFLCIFNPFYFLPLNASMYIESFPLFNCTRWTDDNNGLITLPLLQDRVKRTAPSSKAPKNGGKAKDSAKVNGSKYYYKVAITWSGIYPFIHFVSNWNLFRIKQFNSLSTVYARVHLAKEIEVLET